MTASKSGLPQEDMGAPASPSGHSALRPEPASRLGHSASVLSATLTLALNAEYFDQIASGEKREEYRLATPYWAKRLVGRTYDRVVLTRGYPKGGGVEGQTRLTREYRGFTLTTIKHPHFGSEAVDVFAIDVAHPAQGIEARSDETRSGSAVGESPVGEADAPQSSYPNPPPQRDR